MATDGSMTECGATRACADNVLLTLVCVACGRRVTKPNKQPNVNSSGVLCGLTTKSSCAKYTSKSANYVRGAWNDITRSRDVEWSSEGMQSIAIWSRDDTR
jgi:hypothetical protein